MTPERDSCRLRRRVPTAPHRPGPSARTTSPLRPTATVAREHASQHASRVRPHAPDAVVVEAPARHVVGLIDVAQVDQDRPRHHGLQAVEIERAELLPLGDDHQRVGAFRARVWPVAIGDVAEDGLRLLHAGRIVGADLRPHVLQRGDQRDRGRLAHVVGIRLEGEAEHRDGLAAHLPRQARRRPCAPWRACARR